MRSSALARSRKPRRGTELVCEKVFRPLAHPLVVVLARLRVAPPLVVAAAGAAGIAAAVELGRGSLLVAALLVQLKTLLFAALGWSTGKPALALAGFVALTSVLSLNFNVERLARGAAAAPDDSGRPTALLRGVYGLVYAPQDRLAEALVARRPALTAPLSVSLLANLGMSTQLAAFGLLLALGQPLAFAWLALAEAAAIALALLPIPRQEEEPA